MTLITIIDLINRKKYGSERRVSVINQMWHSSCDTLGVVYQARQYIRDCIKPYCITVLVRSLGFASGFILKCYSRYDN